MTRSPQPLHNSARQLPPISINNQERCDQRNQFSAHWAPDIDNPMQRDVEHPARPQQAKVVFAFRADRNPRRQSFGRADQYSRTKAAFQRWSGLHLKSSGWERRIRWKRERNCTTSRWEAPMAPSCRNSSLFVDDHAFVRSFVVIVGFYEKHK
jgi:hypothetical protein